MMLIKACWFLVWFNEWGVCRMKREEKLRVVVVCESDMRERYIYENDMKLRVIVATSGVE